MNVSSLRINAENSDENFKKINQDLLKIQVEDFWSQELKDHFLLINNSTIPEAQLREIRRLAKLVDKETDQKLNQKIAAKLMTIYFDERPKHPAKSTIQSCFSQSSEQEIVIIAIANEMLSRISSLDMKSLDDCHRFISCLNEATQNFIPAFKALGIVANEISAFFIQLITTYVSHLSPELSPAEKNEIANRLHCVLQVTIFSIKIYINENSERSSRVESNFNEIARECLSLLDLQDIPMDTKSNCAILIVMESKHKSNELYKTWIKDESCSLEKRLCLIFGIINTMSSSNIDYNLLRDATVILREIYLKCSTDPFLMLSVSRSFMLVTKKLATAKCVQNITAFDTISDSALYVAFLNLDHHMDTVRHLSRETIRSLTEIGVSLETGNLIDKIFDEISSLQTINLQSLVILTIAPAIKISEIFKRFPSIHEKLLDAINDCKDSVSNLINCYEILANNSFNEIEFAVWFEKFAEPAIKAMMKYQTQSEERLALENLVMRFVKKEKKVLDEIMKKHREFNIGFVLMSLSCGKKSGRFEKEKSTAEQWKGIISFEEIKEAMIHADATVRTSALLLIVETKKTIEGFTIQEVDCIMHFLKYNINVQSPATRQCILGMVKNIFVRVQAVLQSLIKKKELESAEFYFKFLIDLQEFCLDNLFEGANFSRRTLSLRLLFYVLEAFEKFFASRSSEIWNKEKFSVLMNVTNDPFEANKEMAIEIMKFIPKPIIRDLCEINLNQLKTTMTSIKPPESLSASYIMEVYARFAFNFDEFNEAKSKVFPEFLLMLSWCEKILLEGLQIAEKSLIVASSTSPLYGSVLCIRHLISKLDLKLIASCPLWRSFFNRLIPLSKRLTSVVAPVVNNSSPEGILHYEDYEKLDDKIRDKWIKIVEQTTPQIILLCSWRTVKEVSLLLGDICLRAPIISDGVGLLEVDQVISIGDHFLELLAQTKHRGAFEQSGFGFSQLCLRLWTCHEPELHRLPSDMLQQMIASLSGDDRESNELLTMKNLCATRRSAGLPLMIQALITSELKVSTNKNFHFVMKNLIQFCLNGEMLETRTHSLNILRVLFRCADLNQSIGEYIAGGIKAALLGYGADSWIERNSATLLFSALMVRIFGVQRTKNSDDLNIRNKLTAKIFFLRYPELYDFFMAQLIEAAEYVKADKMNAKLHPLLLLLIRLYPSALEGSETNLRLSGFLPVVTRCSGCVEMQTRILCAKFIANVTPPDLVIPRILETLETLREAKSVQPNAAHGVLLQVLHMIKALPVATVDQEKYSNSLASVLDELAPVRKMFTKKLICFGTMMDIVLEICEKLWVVRTKFLVQIKRELDSCFEFDKSAPFGLPLVLNKLFLIKTMTNFLVNQTDIHLSFVDHKSPMQEEDKQILHSMFNIIIILLDYDYALEMMDEYDINLREVSLINSLPEERKLELSCSIKKDKKLRTTLLSMNFKEHYHLMIKAFDILSMLDYRHEALGFNISEFSEHLASMLHLKITAEDVDHNIIQDLMDNSLSKPEHFKKVLLKFANALLRTNLVSIYKFDFRFLLDISIDSSIYVKHAASDILETISPAALSETSNSTNLFFIKSLLLLLMDDEEEIRDRNAELVMKMMTRDDQKVSPLYAQELFIDFMLTVYPDKYEAMALVVLVVCDETEIEEESNLTFDEYQVFDKHEVNLFSETIIIKRLCCLALKKTLLEIDPSELTDVVLKIVKATRNYADCGSEATIEKFLNNL